MTKQLLIQIKLFKDSCYSKLKYGESTPNDDRLLCRNCTIKKVGPNKESVFMITWNNTANQRLLNKKWVKFYMLHNLILINFSS